MNIVEIKKRSSELILKLIDVWEKSVRATHTFLSDEEINSIRNYVPEALYNVEHLAIINGYDNYPIAFIGIEDDSLEMLFVSPENRGKGIGKTLVKYGIENYGINRVTVNEQNPQAIGFYEHMGFKTFKRTDYDEQGNPYPILYMRIK
ncbi:GNAT family N-acetyltransferase [Peptacetobacter hominis]|uniref:GNAT family N-acetyltransferase n=1 Tax=Peptacetobacter hominis TaxID=2743610 RepID=A0A544QX47_9FIRM|nr:GNAT family N-acetyltransferase [Peptacetobacter hominis]TQQ85241.1 GNAT family N-acetyltransferase [Peptacetobacter hominis]